MRESILYSGERVEGTMIKPRPIFKSNPALAVSCSYCDAAEGERCLSCGSPPPPSKTHHARLKPFEAPSPQKRQALSSGRLDAQAPVQSLMDLSYETG